jgi:hypothetical protein
MFFPLMSGPRHTRHAVEAATAILRATGHGDREGPWVPVGAGVTTGLAWVGAVGDEKKTDLTAPRRRRQHRRPLATAAGRRGPRDGRGGGGRGLDASLPTRTSR